MLLKILNFHQRQKTSILLFLHSIHEILNSREWRGAQANRNKGRRETKQFFFFQKFKLWQISYIVLSKFQVRVPDTRKPKLRALSILLYFQGRKWKGKDLESRNFFWNTLFHPPWSSSPSNVLLVGKMLRIKTTWNRPGEEMRFAAEVTKAEGVERSENRFCCLF